MKKIAFLLDYGALNVPDVNGGAIESLLTMILNKNEYYKKYQLYFIQNEFDKLNNYSYNHSKLIQIHKNKILMFIGRAFNKIFRKCKIKFQLLLPYYKKVIKELNVINPDIIIFQGSYNQLMVDKVKKYFPKVQMLYHIHTQILQKENINDNFDKIITVSDFIKKDYVDYLKKDENKFITLKNAIDISLFEKQITTQERQQIRQKFNVKDDDFLVMYCGRVIKEKGVAELVDAIIKCNQNVKLMIVGGTNFANSKSLKYLNSYFDDIKEKSKLHPDKIIMTDYIERAELYKYYRSSDLQVVPSIWEEAAGLVAIEGQVCGLPQIITNSGGLPEYASAKTIVVNKDENLVDNLAKNIEVLSKNEKLRQEIIQAGYENYKKYSSENYYKDFCDIIDSL